MGGPMWSLKEKENLHLTSYNFCILWNSNSQTWSNNPCDSSHGDIPRGSMHQRYSEVGSPLTPPSSPKIRWLGNLSLTTSKIASSVLRSVLSNFHIPLLTFKLVSAILISKNGAQHSSDLRVRQCLSPPINPAGRTSWCPKMGLILLTHATSISSFLSMLWYHSYPYNYIQHL